MAYKSVDDNSLTALANKIREKANTQDTLSVPNGMITTINSIVRAVSSYNVAYGIISDTERNRRQLIISGLNFLPVGAIFIMYSLGSFVTNPVIGIASPNADITGGMGYVSPKYSPITNNFFTFNNNSVSVTNPTAQDGTTNINAEFSSRYAYVIWGI